VTDFRPSVDGDSVGMRAYVLGKPDGDICPVCACGGWAFLGKKKEQSYYNLRVGETL
jgi:hypothetical protein